MERHALLRMGGFSLCHSKVIGVRHREMDFRSVLDEGDDASPNGRRVRQGKAAFTTGAYSLEKVAFTQYHAPYMRRPTLLTPQHNALRRSALIQGKAVAHRRERTPCT